LQKKDIVDNNLFDCNLVCYYS